MSKKLFAGRYTADNDEDLVVFMIGMRVNKWWAVHKWWPIFMAMPPMIQELSTNKELGCLGTEYFFGKTTMLVQYWRSTEDLLAYSRGPKHSTAWKNFNQKVGNNDAVGIFHETYIVQKGNYESIYVNMPRFGLANATQHKAVNTSTNTASKRIKSG